MSTMWLGKPEKKCLDKEEKHLSNMAGHIIINKNACKMRENCKRACKSEGEW